jgi:hypothetical protein
LSACNRRAGVTNRRSKGQEKLSQHTLLIF